MPSIKAQKILSIYKAMKAFEDSVPAAIKQKMLDMTRRKSSRLVNRTSSFG